MSRNQEKLPPPHAGGIQNEPKNEHRTFLLNLSKKIVEANRTRDMAPITLTPEDQRGALWAACLVEGNNVKLQVVEKTDESADLHDAIHPRAAPIGDYVADCIRPDVRSDIEEYREENPLLECPEIQDMTAFQVIDAYLKWNGIQGYTRPLIDLIETLGWKR